MLLLMAGKWIPYIKKQQFPSLMAIRLSSTGRTAERVIVDSGPQFACQKSTASSGFSRVVPSQHLPQFNSEAEAAVRIAKKIY